MTKEKIANYIKAETQGGYLQDWEEAALLITRKQQKDYFLILAEDILALIIRQIENKLTVIGNKEIITIRHILKGSRITPIEYAKRFSQAQHQSDLTRMREELK